MPRPLCCLYTIRPCAPVGCPRRWTAQVPMQPSLMMLSACPRAGRSETLFSWMACHRCISNAHRRTTPPHILAACCAHPPRDEMDWTLAWSRGALRRFHTSGLRTTRATLSARLCQWRRNCTHTPYPHARFMQNASLTLSLPDRTPGESLPSLLY